jgi:hypothetical protein
VHVPVTTPVTVVPDTAQTEGVGVEKVTARPELDVALNVTVAPIARLLGRVPNVIACAIGEGVPEAALSPMYKSTEGVDRVVRFAFWTAMEYV